ncbi:MULTISPECIES: TetR/AcrR family transcriptional regulator [unclassified Schlesneria]|uniref:TetR/AcrR family transcriptional regulator n=1 Tax=unclassified Schlesneria TaxID=2762017 RepID=UPI002F04D41C
MTRKQRQIKEREQLFLQVARKLLIEQGYAGLSMDQLAEATEYSKGTVYQHFSTKEDLVTALAIESMERRVELFLRAEQFVGRSRERLAAIGVADEIFSRLEPHHYHSEFIIKLANLRERASAERREALDRLESACFGTVLRIVQAGVDAGELRPTVDSRELVYSVITMALGTHMTALHYCPMLKEFEIQDPVKVLMKGIHTLLDGFDWKPLSGEWNYEVSRQRVLSEIFAPEQASLGLN